MGSIWRDKIARGKLEEGHSRSKGGRFLRRSGVRSPGDGALTLLGQHIGPVV